jgi:hypothetical protein
VAAQAGQEGATGAAETETAAMSEQVDLDAIEKLGEYVLILVAELRVARELLADAGLSHVLADAVAQHGRPT